MIKADSLEGITDKLSAVLEHWQPSLPGSISHRLWPTENELCVKCRENRECFKQEFKESFKDIAKEIHGRGVLQGVIINTLITGTKFAFSAVAGGTKVASDLTQLALESAGFSVATFTGKVVGIVGSTIAGVVGGYKNYRRDDDAVLVGVLLGPVPWLYSEIWLGSFAKLFLDDNYLKENLKESVTTK